MLKQFFVHAEWHEYAVALTGIATAGLILFLARVWSAARCGDANRHVVQQNAETIELTSRVESQWR
jgi:hypothetical protein